LSRAAPDVARLFFALWPDRGVRERLARWSAELRRVCGGRFTRKEHLHVTLAFLGNVARDRLPSLLTIAEAASAPAFTLRFDTPGYWARKRLAWAAPTTIPDSLAALAAGLSAALRNAGLQVEDRPYFPHVTLLRDARCGELPTALEAFEWCVQDFVLVESMLEPNGAVYRVIGRWPLDGAAS
jgi:2'-5' RNA ligase